MADEALGKILGSGRDLGGGVSGAGSAWRREVGRRAEVWALPCGVVFPLP